MMAGNQQDERVLKESCETVVFLDTNVLLHYPPIRDCDWISWSGKRPVSLMLCMQVVHELDEKKDHPTLSKRAERAISEIHRIRNEDGFVREGVTLKVFNHEIKRTEFAESLSYDSKDDRIAYSILMYQQFHQDVTVACCTEDMGMSLRCEAHNITVIDPDRSSRLENPSGQYMRRINLLTEEIDRLKSQAPDIKIKITQSRFDEFSGTDSSAPLVLKPPDTINIEDAIHQEHSERALEPDDDEKSRTKPPIVTGNDLIKFAQQANIGRRAKYREDLNQYLRNFRAYLEEANAFFLTLGHMIRLDISIANVGGSPADDLEIELLLPPFFKQVEYEGSTLGTGYGDAPKRPTPPEKPASGSMGLLGSLRPEILRDRIWFPQNHLHNSVTQMPRLQLAGTVEDGVTINIEIMKLLHHKQNTFNSIDLMFLPERGVSNFNLDCEVTAGNLPERQSYEIPVLLDDS